MQGHVVQFIVDYLEFFADAIPIALTETKEGKSVPTLVVPFVKVKDFFREYEYHCESASPPIYSMRRAKYSVFRKAFREMHLKHIVKLQSGKSGFPCCSVCNNLLGLKKSACCKKDTITRDVILKLARLHLLQQSTERQHAENVINRAAKLDVDGQPTVAYFDVDGQSVWTGNTPKFSRKGERQSKMKACIENRNIGVRVVCGPIDEYISVSTNNLIPGGANVLVEVVKYSVEYLSRRLGEYSMVLPKSLALQFDNSGENKVILSILLLFFVLSNVNYYIL